jgi:hypothetical protein
MTPPPRHRRRVDAIEAAAHPIVVESSGGDVGETRLARQGWRDGTKLAGNQCAAQCRARATAPG